MRIKIFYDTGKLFIESDLGFIDIDCLPPMGSMIDPEEVESPEKYDQLFHLGHRWGKGHAHVDWIELKKDENGFYYRVNYSLISR